MIYFDNRGHMISDESYEELHQFAARLKLKRKWFQHQKRPHPHYDLTTERKRVQALQMGANQVSSKEIVRILRKSRYNKDKEIPSKHMFDDAEKGSLK